MNKRTITLSVATAAIAACGLLPAAQASPAAHHHAAATSRTEHFTLVSSSVSGNGSIILTGAFTAGGKDKSGNKVDTLTFHNGTLKLNHGGHGTYHQKFNKKTCYIRGVETGKFKVGHGTGAYSGITGHGKYHGVFTGVLKKTSSGACDMKSKPYAFQEVITAKGPVSGTVGS